MSDAAAPLPARKSLRAKAWLATLALLAYGFGAGLYITTERAGLYDTVQRLEQVSQHDRALALTEAAVANALLDVSESGSAAHDGAGAVNELRLYMESCAKLFEDLGRHDPGTARLQRAIQRSYDALQQQPVRANWIELRESLRRAVDDLDIRHRQLAGEREALITGYQRQYDAVTVESLLLAAFGLTAFGSLAAWFFAGLAHDIRRLQDHALAIVRGARGVTMAVRREDELGRLMHAVNRMSADLDEREKQLQLEAQQRSHQDRMLAVGALAAGVAHEVNNPLAVISGAVQDLQAQLVSPPSALSTEQLQQLRQATELILAQARRAGHAARHLAEVAAPQPAEMDWLDLNALLRQAVQLQGYDRRYRRFEFDLQIDSGLPAVHSSASAVQQLLVQLLALVCDALAARTDAAQRLHLSTAHRLSDSGTGRVVAVELRFAPVLDFTRAEVQRSLLLCRAIVEPIRGQLAFGQVAGPLQRIQWILPTEVGGDEG